MNTNATQDIYFRHNRLLSELLSGQFVSGSELAQRLHLSKSAVNKRMQQLNDLGLEISSVRGKGYRLRNADHWIDSQNLACENFPLDLGYRPICGSTNELLRQGSLVNGQCKAIISDLQTAGRGRRGRTWFATPGDSLLLSFRMPVRDTAQLSWLSLAVAWHVLQALKQMGASDLSIKWPNDLYFSGRKLAGILIELVGNLDQGFEAIIGLGLNCFNSRDARIDQDYATLQQAIGQDFNKTHVATELIKVLYEKLVVHFEAPSVQDWREVDYLFNKAVRLQQGDQWQNGFAKGVSAEGQLLFEGADGQLQRINGGEVSVRLDERD